MLSEQQNFQTARKESSKGTLFARVSAMPQFEYTLYHKMKVKKNFMGWFSAT